VVRTRTAATRTPSSAMARGRTANEEAVPRRRADPPRLVTTHTSPTRSQTRRSRPPTRRRVRTAAAKAAPALRAMGTLVASAAACPSSGDRACRRGGHCPGGARAPRPLTRATPAHTLTNHDARDGVARARGDQRAPGWHAHAPCAPPRAADAWPPVAGAVHRCAVTSAMLVAIHGRHDPVVTAPGVTVQVGVPDPLDCSFRRPDLSGTKPTRLTTGRAPV